MGGFHALGDVLAPRQHDERALGRGLLQELGVGPYGAVGDREGELVLEEELGARGGDGVEVGEGFPVADAQLLHVFVDAVEETVLAEALEVKGGALVELTGEALGLEGEQADGLAAVALDDAVAQALAAFLTLVAVALDDAALDQVAEHVGGVAGAVFFLHDGLVGGHEVAGHPAAVEARGSGEVAEEVSVLVLLAVDAALPEAEAAEHGRDVGQGAGDVELAVGAVSGSRHEGLIEKAGGGDRWFQHRGLKAGGWNAGGGLQLTLPGPGRC
ncbi:hypothetical protein BEN47_19360 [Hymenobacter lapidarius]|uniref:Uncharacterized protein n=1 Tax=Hymenobacter lapidarius TaxID=1908237 RepID=A0A1G1SRA1_9BACT|nr:hypothetical protein BEN47_19360 [Hymenobacter lapidarius]